MKPVHILATIPSLSLGGAEKAFISWVKLLKNQGYIVTVLTTESDIDFFTLPEGTSRIRRKKEKFQKKEMSLWGRFFWVFQRIFEPYANYCFIKKEIQRVQPDIVIAHLPKVAIPSIAASLKNNVPCIVMEHSYQANLKDPILQVLRNILYPKSQGLVVLTPLSQVLFQNLNKRIRIIANPIDKPILEDPLQYKEKIILLAGRLTKVKQFAVFLDYFSQYDWKGWQLWIAGEGDERELLESKIDYYHLREKVSLLGAIADMKEIYSKASIFILCSQIEGYSMVLAESAIYGCVRISFNCPSGPETLIKEGKTGFLIENQNWESLFQQIQKIIHDESLRKIISEKTYQDSCVSSCNISQEWQNLIQEVLNDAS